MNYKELIEQFWKTDLDTPINPFATKFFFFIIETTKEQKGKQPIGHSDRYLAERLDIALGTVKKCKDLLMDRKLITYYSPASKSKSLEGQTKYWLGTVSPDSTVNGSTVSRHSTVSKQNEHSTVSRTVSPYDTDEPKKQPTVSPDSTVDSSTVSPGDTNYILSNTYSTNKKAEVADAPSLSKDQSSKKEKKKKGGSSAAPEPSLYTNSIAVYDKWFKELSDGIPPMIDGAQGKAMKSIMAHLKRMWRQKHEGASEEYIEQYSLKSWTYVLDNWHCLSNFKQGKTKLTEINSDLQNILVDIKNAIDKKGNSGANQAGANNQSKGGGGTIDDIQSLKRNRPAGSDERVDVTNHEVVE